MLAAEIRVGERFSECVAPQLTCRPGKGGAEYVNPAPFPVNLTLDSPSFGWRVSRRRGMKCHHGTLATRFWRPP
jgi:hypothetical protein